MNCEQKVDNWYGNHAPTKSKRLPKSIKVTWTPLQVFTVLSSKEIKERRDEITMDPKLQIGAWNTAQAQLWDATTDEESRYYEQEAEAWTMKGIHDPELKAR